MLAVPGFAEQLDVHVDATASCGPSTPSGCSTSRSSCCTTASAGADGTRSRRAPAATIGRGRRHTGAAMSTLTDLLPPVGSDPAAVLDAFAEWAMDGGRPLYPHQDEAAFALATGDHVVLATPTGSGKSLVAIAGVAAGPQRGPPGGVDGADQGVGGREVLRSRRPARRDERRAGHRGRGDQRRRADPRVHRRGARQPRARHRAGQRLRVRLPRRVPLLRRPRPRVGVAGPAARADQLPDAAGLGDARRHERHHDRPGRALGTAGHRGDVGRSTDAALPPVAHDAGRRERPGRREGRAQPGVRRARQPGRGHRAGPGTGQPQRHDAGPSARRSSPRWPASAWVGGSATR